MFEKHPYQEALRYQNDLSEKAERVNHWDMAKTVGVDEFGKLTSLIKKNKDGSYDDSDHAKAAAAEIFKMDPQMIIRSLNRLAFGGESPNADGSRTFSMSLLGDTIVKGLSSVFIDHEKRLLGNTAFNLSSPEVVKHMKEINASPQVINIIQKSIL